MMLIRRFEKRRKNIPAKIRGFRILASCCRGVSQALNPKDYVLGTLSRTRSCFYRGIDADSIMAEMFGKQEGCSRGRGIYALVVENFYGGNAIVCGIYLSVGMAWHSRNRKNEYLLFVFLAKATAVSFMRR
jgi:TPP-dependent pyruvate/acetoin dehydrogenase alpha subunit